MLVLATVGIFMYHSWAYWLHYVIYNTMSYRSFFIYKNLLTGTVIKSKFGSYAKQPQFLSNFCYGLDVCMTFELRLDGYVWLIYWSCESEVAAQWNCSSIASQWSLSYFYLILITCRHVTEVKSRLQAVKNKPKSVSQPATQR